MQERADNIQFYLFSEEKGELLIPEIKDFDSISGDLIQRDKKRKTFSFKKATSIVAYGEANEYLKTLITTFGIIPDCRLITKIKSNDRIDQRIKTRSNVGVDLGSCIFTSTQVTFDTLEGGLMGIIESRINDDYDILAENSVKGNRLSSLKTVNVVLDSRQILKRSRLEVINGTRVNNNVSGGDRLNANGFPFEVDYNSDETNIKSVYNDRLNAFNNNYARLTSDRSSNLIYNISESDKTLTLNGNINIKITEAHRGSLRLDIIIYKDNIDYNYSRRISLDTCNPGALGDECNYTFNDYKLQINEGESWTIGTLSDTIDGIEYSINNTYLIISEDATTVPTRSKAIRLFDLFERLVSIATGKENSFKSSIFDVGGKYEDILVTQGQWIRNVPDVINEGEQDERRIQVKASLNKIIEGVSILEPLRYGVITEGNKEYFCIETEKSAYQKFNSIKLGQNIQDEFQYITIQEEERKIIPKNYYSSITIGSTTTGSDYAEVNNLYSICGNATWNTINDKKESVYKYTTEIRTGAEDVELTKQFQYNDRPDLDNERDNDLFFLDCKQTTGDYRLKKWQDIYPGRPKNVYSPDTNYNWRFIPRELLRGHEWKISAGLIQYSDENLRFISSNCNSSLITRRDGDIEKSQDSAIPHWIMERPVFKPVSVTFKLPINQDIQDMLRGFTSDIDNKYGIVKARTESGYVEDFYLIKVSETGSGEWELIETY